eukprot:TRINITY_DN5457_c0_g1_i2.p1 TRINITY_DN5457_c0_g1~~TRINITY_DN5457_c0_g1_i2.p1  ORF type:complete len:519 (+),score=-12.42 TRINITY_DN5457_c0_g1_i2:64-1557(+)
MITVLLAVIVTVATQPNNTAIWQRRLKRTLTAQAHKAAACGPEKWLGDKCRTTSLGPEAYEQPPRASGITCQGKTSKIVQLSASARSQKPFKDGSADVSDRILRWYHAGGNQWSFRCEPRVSFEAAVHLPSNPPATSGILTAAGKAISEVAGVGPGLRYGGAVTVTSITNQFVNFSVAVPASDFGAARALTTRRLRSGSVRNAVVAALKMDIPKNKEARKHKSMVFPQALTVVGRKDGFGSQLWYTWALLAFGRRHRIPFCRTPWSEMAHVDPATMHVLEEFSGVTQLPGRLRWASQNLFSFRVGDGLNALVTYVGWFTQEYFDKDTLGLFRAMYWSRPKPTVFPPKANHINVALHLRAGDIAGRPRDADVFNRTAVIERVIEKVRSQFSRKGKLQFFWFTEPGAKIPIKAPDIRVCIDWTETKTFHGFVTADVLVMDRSTFSWTAGFLSRGVVYYPVFPSRMAKDGWKGLTQGGRGLSSAWKSGLSKWRPYDAQGK